MAFSSGLSLYLRLYMVGRASNTTPFTSTGPLPAISKAFKLRIAGDHRDVGVEPVSSGAHDDHVCRLIHRIQPRNLGRIGIGHDNDIVTFYPEAGVPVPFYLHALLASLCTRQVTPRP